METVIGALTDILKMKAIPKTAIIESIAGHTLAE
jgi:hypothetical protein